jgi:hypothetical protein
MKYQQNYIFKKAFVFFVLIFIGLMSASVTYAAPINVDINWDPEDIEEGNKLGSNQLNAYAVDSVNGNYVYGKYTYSPSKGTLASTPGTLKLHVDFKPGDLATYNPASEDATINVLAVERVTPTIIWNDPADITSGTKLSSAQLNAKAVDDDGNTVKGKYVYNPKKGTKLGRGEHELEVTFTPKDSKKYDVVIETVTINVVKKSL